MVVRSSARWLAVAAGLALALPAAAAQADSPSPVARAAGGDPVPPSPSIVGVPISRTESALSNAADAIDAGDGPAAASYLTASRRHLIRSYNGAKYLVTHPPAAPPAEEASAAPQSAKFVKMARRAIRASHARAAGHGGWITAKASQDDEVAAFADGPTSVFNVLTSQYSAATTAVGMAPDATGTLLARVKTSLDTAIVLRNRLVKVVQAAEPPVAEEAGATAHASQDADDAVTYATVMPGLIALLDDEQQQMQALSADASTPAEAKAILSDALAADQQIETLVNTAWPPVAAD